MQIFNGYEDKNADLKKTEKSLGQASYQNKVRKIIKNLYWSLLRNRIF
jgi:hypothetical protein